MKRTLTAALLWSSALNLNAQVIYTDIPDVLITPSGTTSYNVDLNGTTTDFTLTATGNIGSGVTKVLAGSAGNPFNRILTNANGELKNVPIGISIAGMPPGTDLWDPYTLDLPASVFVSSTPYMTEFLSPNNTGYIAIAFIIGTSRHFGWVQVSVDNSQVALTVLDYAYESTPNTPIIVGDKGLTTAVTNHQQESPNIFVNQQHLFVHYPSEALVNLSNLSGQVVKSFSINVSSMKFSVGDLPAGIYIVSVADKKQHIIQRKKIVIN